MLITVSGPPGSGKSTVASAVAARFGYEHVSGGDIFRSLAAERGLSLAAFNELAETDESIDLDLDRELREIARDRDDLVLEARLAGWMAGEYADLRVWLDAPLRVRASRIADREGTDPAAARAATVTREESECGRYEAYYGIDIRDRSIYDVAVNTARWDAETISTCLIGLLETYDPAVDEGAFTVDLTYEF